MQYLWSNVNSEQVVKKIKNHRGDPMQMFRQNFNFFRIELATDMNSGQKGLSNGAEFFEISDSVGELCAAKVSKNPKSRFALVTKDEIFYYL